MLALLFPGQASQAVGMGSDLRQASPAARHLFDLADELTGLPITRLCAEGPLERLTDTEVAQPAVVVTSLAALRVLSAELDLYAPSMAAACRGVDGTMAAVIGLDEPALRAACEAASRDGSSVEVANLNAPGQLIVSGARDAIERVAEHAKAAGARRVLPLNVGGPFHSAYMRPAAEALAAAIAATEFRQPDVP